MPTPQSTEALGRSHLIRPPDFAATEELLVAFSETAKRPGSAQLRVWSAMLGICTRLGRDSGADYAAHRFDVLAYGGEVYSWLRKQGMSPAEIATAAGPVLTVLAESAFPRASEVEAAAGNSVGSVASSTALPSS